MPDGLVSHCEATGICVALSSGSGKDVYGNNYAETHIENPLIPLTNNTVELVNRRFDQHYQNMCGFDGIETARNYLHLFELTYRFTPFAQDNRPVKGRELDIRGKYPLELAGYDISHMPIAQVARAQLLAWPPILQELVPNA